MNKNVAIILVVLATMLFGRSQDAFSQYGPLQQRLAKAARLECNFSALATANWDESTASATVAPTEFEISFFDVNVDEGTAEADSRFGPSFIVVRYSNAYLHLMQMFDAGPLYVTTILARETADGRMMAVHTRHEYTPTSLPGFTSRPEMYVGDCAVSG